MSNFLVSKLPSYLTRLKLAYSHSGKILERDLIETCKYYVIAEADYDNWNGGTYGHEVVLFVPIEDLAKVEIDSQSDVCRGICDDLRKLTTGVDNEWFSKVRLEMSDESDAEYQRAIALTARAVANPDNLAFWKSGLARLFKSHRDAHKRSARALGDELESFGISSFVAHDTIKPMSEWRSEILKGLETMEVMLTFLTDDFDESLWCQQEVGFALGKGVPIISLKLGHRDSPGFIGHVQAYRGSANDPSANARGLFPLLGEALGRKERFHDVTISSFVTAKSFNDARDTFDRMSEIVTTLSDQQLQTIIIGFARNDQLYNAGYLTSNSNRLIRYLHSATGRNFVIRSAGIHPLDKLEDFPF